MSTISSFNRTHYKEHLVKVINKHRLDPVDKYTLTEAMVVVRREKIPYEVKPVNITEREYLIMMKDKIRHERPLQPQPY